MKRFCSEGVKRPGGAYRPGLLKRTTPRQLTDAANGAFDQRFVLDERDRFMGAVRAPARDHDRKFLICRQIGERDGRSRAQPRASDFALRIDFPFWTPGLAFSRDKSLQA